MNLLFSKSVLKHSIGSIRPNDLRYFEQISDLIILSNSDTGFICVCKTSHLSPKSSFNFLSVNYIDAPSIQQRMNWHWELNTIRMLMSHWLNHRVTWQEGNEISHGMTWLLRLASSVCWHVHDCGGTGPDPGLTQIQSCLLHLAIPWHLFYWPLNCL